MPASASEYTVKAGDTLLSIARQHLTGVNIKDQQAINDFVDKVVNNNPAHFPNANPDQLSTGMKLQIPDSAPVITSKPELVSEVVTIPQSSSTPGAEIIGHITKLNGQGWLLHSDETRQKLYIGLGVKQGDNILTNHQSATKIDFLDGSSMSLKQQSQIKINEYNWNEQDKTGRSILSFLKGAFRAVTGLIAKQDPIDYSILTPVATIGVRGTDFGARLCKQEFCEIQSKDHNITISEGIYIGVLQGKIVAQSGDRETLVNAGEAIYQKNAASEPKQVSNLPGLIFSTEELETFLLTKKLPVKILKKEKVVKKKTPFYDAFLLNGMGSVVKDSQGNCIRSGGYRKNHHVAECK